MRWLAGLILVLALGVSPAAAHKLRVFALAEGAVVSGYGFFVGGGRTNGATVTLLGEGAPTPVSTQPAGADGTFRFEAVAAGAHVVRVDAGDGHVAEARVTVTAGAATRSHSAEAAPAPATPNAASATACLDDTALHALIATAVAREVRPIAERIEAADAQLRLTDIAGGLGMIMGLAGLALWARSKRLIGPPE
jgi:nickel transport protein